MNSTDRSHVEALAKHIARAGYIKFGEMNEFLESCGINMAGDEELTGEHVGQPHVAVGTTLLGSVSDEYVQTVEALFKWWPVKLMIGDPASFASGEEPWWVTWAGRPNLLTDGITMSRRPAVNPDLHDIADRAKHAYATGTQVLAVMQYRLAELAGTGRLDPDESMSLQHDLVSIWEALYSGTVCAVRDADTDDSTWDEADNTYSDGRPVMIQIRIEPWEESVVDWEYNRFMLGEGAVNEHPHGTICHISPRKRKDDRGVANASPKDLPGEFAALGQALQPATDWAEGAQAQSERLNDDDDSEGVGDGQQ
jgi:hypothetical protein